VSVGEPSVKQAKRMSRFEDIVKTGLSRIDTIRVTTAVNPLLWLTGITLPLCLGAAVFIPDRAFRFVLIAVPALAMVAAIVAYFILLFRDPDRLQSEEYQIRQTELRMRYSKGRRPGKAELASKNQLANSSPGVLEHGDER
jgi:hypothetical protein